MRLPLILAVSVILLVFQCENANCQEAGVDEPTTKKPGFFSRLFGKGGSSSTTTSTTTTTTTTPRNNPAAVPTPARQPANRVQPSPYNPLVNPNLGPGMLPNYPKPHQQPSGLSLSYDPTPPPRGVHSGGSKTPLAPMATPPISPTPAVALAPVPTSTTTTTTTSTTTTMKPKQIIPQAPLTKPESFSDFEDPKKSIMPTPSSTTTRKPTTVKEDFPALPAPRRPSIKEDFPALPSKPSSPVPVSPTPTSPSAWGSTPPANGNRVSFVPHVPGSTSTVSPGSATTEKSLATDDEIRQLSETLYQKETNSQLSQITVNIQGKTRSIDTSDEAPQPLLQVDEKALQPPTIAKMRDLFNNYEIDTSINEYVTPIERKEENDFVDAIMATNVMRQAMLFLQNKGIVSPDPKTHRDLVKSLWFTLYSRGQGKIGSSGFEHVFVNEVKNGTIIGLHNWVYFNEEEKAGRIDYKGYLKKLDLGNKGMVVKTRFTHNGLNKPVNTLFIGTSPELEIALYTVCFELRADKLCPVSLGGNPFSIQTYSWRYRGKNLIGSAYPEI
ncbi:endoribonuclease CG2145-like [Episyrphus balteatus]|uniref:endoribonuclease CG2145-like n=1 Tax=Episyrphus balteatus TaxID=286459 RepID=UPI002485F81B|nr:endoribonuclease CG2145-like [Episyrphus balteatus]